MEFKKPHKPKPNLEARSDAPMVSGATPDNKPNDDKNIKTIDLNLSLPSFGNLNVLKNLKFLRKISPKHIILILGGAVIAIAGLYIYNTYFVHDNVNIDGSVSDIKHENPTYGTITPNGKSVDKNGGWSRISPPERNPVYAYLDKIDGISVSVSEQPLPDSFKNDPAGKVAELAKDYSANEELEAGDIKVHLGTSGKGPQSAIFTKHDLLILIKSKQKIDEESWSRYIKSLR